MAGAFLSKRNDCSEKNKILDKIVGGQYENNSYR